MIVAVTTVVLFGLGRVVLGWSVLGGMAVVDALVWFAVGRCLVCYRCRSEFRSVAIAPDHEGWDLGIGEKYRTVTQDAGPVSDLGPGQEGRVS